MNLHIIGGFLGSGKTTAIISATKSLLRQGKKVGVVTNDKGKNLVDTAFFEAQNIPTGEVPGGCFRCSFDELQKQVKKLKTEENPDVLFAESVGSCADMVATVIQPLLELKEAAGGAVSFSVFTDIRLFRHWIYGEELPFSEEVIYIFEKQIEEADFLILNKGDLIPAETTAEILKKTQQLFPEKTLLLQNSLTPEGTLAWLEQIESAADRGELKPIEIDYRIYDKGSRQLGWLDEKILISCPTGQGHSILKAFFEHCTKDLQAENIPIAHLKFFIKDDSQQAKISFTSLEEGQLELRIPEMAGTQIQLLINGRIQTAPARINRLIQSAIDECCQQEEVSFTRSESVYFRPKIQKTRS